MYELEKIDNLENLDLGTFIVIKDHVETQFIKDELIGRLIGLDNEKDTLTICLRKKLEIYSNNIKLVDIYNKDIEKESILSYDYMLLSNKEDNFDKQVRIRPLVIQEGTLLFYEETYLLKNYTAKEIFKRVG